MTHVSVCHAHQAAKKVASDEEEHGIVKKKNWTVGATVELLLSRPK